MKKIISNPKPLDTVVLHKIIENIKCDPYHFNACKIFAKKDGKMAGMVNYQNEKYALKTGLSYKSGEPLRIYISLRELIETNEQYGYTFYLEDPE